MSKDGTTTFGQNIIKPSGDCRCVQTTVFLGCGISCRKLPLAFRREEYGGGRGI